MGDDTILIRCDTSTEWLSHRKSTIELIHGAYSLIFALQRQYCALSTVKKIITSENGMKIKQYDFLSPAVIRY